MAHDANTGDPRLAVMIGGMAAVVVTLPGDPGAMYTNQGLMRAGSLSCVPSRER